MTHAWLQACVARWALQPTPPVTEVRYVTGERVDTVPAALPDHYRPRPFPIVWGAAESPSPPPLRRPAPADGDDDTARKPKPKPADAKPKPAGAKSKQSAASRRSAVPPTSTPEGNDNDDDDEDEDEPPLTPPKPKRQRTDGAASSSANAGSSSSPSRLVAAPASPLSAGTKSHSPRGPVARAGRARVAFSKLRLAEADLQVTKKKKTT